MDIAELRNKLDSIAAELAEHDVQQEDIAIEEEQVEEVEQPVAEEEFAEEDDLEIEEEEVAEEEVEETVEVPVSAIAELMQLAGFENYKPVQEFANSPEDQVGGAQGEPVYMDSEEQLIAMSGGLNGPKSMHAASALGDNPMNQQPRKVEEVDEAINTVEESLYKSYKDFLEEAEINAKED